MNNKSPIVFVFALVFALSLAACDKPDATVEATPVIVGADRDSHGCIGSAGYSWCAYEAKCVRSWELAKEKNIPLDEKSLSVYCNKSPD